MTALPTSPDALMKRLCEWGIAYELHSHKAVFTAEEAATLKGELPDCLHTRNLYLRNKKKQNFLVTLADETEVDLKKLADRLEAGRFSFGSSDRLMQFLGVTPGSVTPFALINDPDHQVQPVWDAAMFNHKLAGYHPLLNSMTLTVNPQILHDFTAQTGHQPIVMDFTGL